MITCPNCGAGNKPGSSACRMCAASLEGIAEAPAARVQPSVANSPYSSTPESQHREEVKQPVEQEGIVCSGCNTMNEPGWSFCQQCGMRLAQAAAPPPQAPAAPPAPVDLRTVMDQQVVLDPSFAQGLRTNPEPQPAAQGLKSVGAQPPPIERSLRTVADERPPAEHSTKPPLYAAPPTVVAQPPLQPHSSDLDSSEMPTLETPAQPKPTAPTPPQPPVQQRPVAPTPIPPLPKPSTPAPPSAPDPTTTRGASTSGVSCTQCGHNNSVGSAFCAGCGAPLTFGKTMVISSQPAPVLLTGRLHLVMEGGQPGEVYELEGDTVIGRSSGEITFPHDGFMSGRHARIERRGSSFILTDEGSRNGTFIKTIGEVELKPGDMILVGKQLFRFEV